MYRRYKSAYFSNRGNMRGVLNKISNRSTSLNEPNNTKFYYYFNGLRSPPQNDYFNWAYEAGAMREYDSTSGKADTNYGNSAIEEIINSNFTYDEINSAIEFLKSNKSPGIDDIPAEFIKACKSTLTQPIMVALNHIIEARDFPSVLSAVFKNGRRDQVDNFRGITILPIIEKYSKS